MTGATSVIYNCICTCSTESSISLVTQSLLRITYMSKHLEECLAQSSALYVLTNGIVVVIGIFLTFTLLVGVDKRVLDYTMEP